MIDLDLTAARHEAVRFEPSERFATLVSTRQWLRLRRAWDKFVDLENFPYGLEDFHEMLSGLTLDLRAQFIEAFCLAADDEDSMFTAIGRATAMTVVAVDPQSVDATDARELLAHAEGLPADDGDVDPRLAFLRSEGLAS
ncbi:hypothetical protein GKE82_23780 [Conexibacter sp. W3-3-2]|uniref:hypothetical protein n=1 Tax=Conexibacter sp. W3-3-2 TaxID=2675227 RepID=UPI0012B700A1|nr:hypothetical protein [Conexibacter sp. W3-3-2]MTD47227.1 hypothetical protein [Conexibacter sp. W3-3-2]